MSLFIKALKYREKFLKEHIIGTCLGLLKKVILYIKNKKYKNKLTDTIDINKKIYIDSKINKVEVAKNKKITLTDYSDLIDKTTNELSELPISHNLSYEYFNSIISSNFYFQKSALLTYSPSKTKFIFRSGKNLDKQTKSKLSFDIKYNDIFIRMIKDNSYILYPDNLLFNNSKDIFSNSDLEDSDFQLYIPFIFSGHVIGIFIGLKLEDNRNLDKDFIKSLEKIGKLNSSLLYKIIQNNNE